VAKRTPARCHAISVPLIDSQVEIVAGADRAHDSPSFAPFVRRVHPLSGEVVVHLGQTGCVCQRGQARDAAMVVRPIQRSAITT
jgi:hypothetical protein